MKSPLKSAIQGPNKSKSSGKNSSSQKSFPDNDIRTQEPNIVVAGIGGGGNNTIKRIASQGIEKVDMAAINTDKTHLKDINTDKKITIGERITQGKGAGGSPQIGKRAAENSAEKLRSLFRGADLVFLSCGLGGGTGTGGTPVAARIAKEEGAVVTGVATMPFEVEKREEKAKKGLKKLRKHSDSVIVMDNNKLYDRASDIPMRYAFAMADEVLTRTLKGITETIMFPSLMNLDFADVKAIMEEGNLMLVGTGEAKGENRAEKSVKQALSCPLLGDIDYSTADGVLMHLSGSDVTMKETQEVANIVRRKVNPDADIIPGARMDRTLEGTVQTILLMSGVSSPLILGPDSESKKPFMEDTSREKAGSSINLNLDYV